MIGEIYNNNSVSTYQPDKAVVEFTSFVKRDYSQGHEILTKPFVELNDRSVIDDMDRGQRTFNAFVDESIENPAEAWKWRGTRSKARNKAIAMHANLTSGYIVPNFLAQNENDDEDLGMSDIMRDVAEWMIDNSNYKSAYLMTTMGMLMNPVNYMTADWAEIYQTIKARNENGELTKKQIVDEVLSGFQSGVLSADQLLITNAYTQNIQRQRAIIKRRYIDWTEAKAKYGEHENWQYVHAGIKAVYNDDDGRFYDIKDEEHPTMVEEATYINRRDDTEACFLNGI